MLLSSKESLMAGICGMVSEWNYKVVSDTVYFELHMYTYTVC